jgi:hypothetical protein
MDLSSLVALAGKTLVTAAVTDAWETARHRFARLFGRGKPDPGTERRLEATHSQLVAASAADLERMQADLASQWALRLTDLLQDHPDAEAELRALVDEIVAMLPVGAVSAIDYSVAAGRDVNVRADHKGVAAAVIQGNVALPGPIHPGPPMRWLGPGSPVS